MDDKIKAQLWDDIVGRYNTSDFEGDEDDVKISLADYVIGMIIVSEGKTVGQMIHEYRDDEYGDIMLLDIKKSTSMLFGMKGALDILSNTDTGKSKKSKDCLNPDRKSEREKKGLTYKYIGGL